MPLQRLKKGHEYIITTAGVSSVDACRFNEYVGNISFTFFYHVDATNMVTVSHRDSGKRIAQVMRDDYRVKEKDYARDAVSDLVAKYGADKVRCILTSAKTLDL